MPMDGEGCVAAAMPSRPADCMKNSGKNKGTNGNARHRATHDRMARVTPKFNGDADPDLACHRPGCEPRQAGWADLRRVRGPVPRAQA